MNKDYINLKKYLKLRRKKDDHPIIIYFNDENGNPILDYNKISIMKVRIERGKEVVVAFDSKSEFQYIRYEALEKYFHLSKLKKIVDQKISQLETESKSELESKSLESKIKD